MFERIKNVRLAFFSTALLSLSTLPMTAHAYTGYVVSNKADANTVIGFSFNDGKFQDLGEFPTGGKGTGDLEVPGLSPRDDNHPLTDGQDPLISAYAIEKTQDGRFVLVANPGDGTISSMKVNEDSSLTAVSTVDSGGKFPISIATHGSTVVVANIGSGNFKGNLASFSIDENGVLALSEGPRSKLGSLGGRPSTVRFTPDGSHVVVAQILSGVLAVFSVEDGELSKKAVNKIESHQADGMRALANPVGFVLVDRGDHTLAVVSEARFFAPGLQLPKRDGQFFFETSSASSYKIMGDGEISAISQDAMTGLAREGGQRTNCWIGISADGKYAYGVNALDSSISSYNIMEDGGLKLLNETAYKTPEYTFLTDIYPTDDGKYFLQLHGFGGKVSVLKVEQDGALTEMGVWEGGVPEVGAFGVLAF